MTDFYNESRVNLRDRVFLRNDFSRVHQTFLDCVGKLQKGVRILDIGTGNGYVLSEIEKKYPDYYNLFGADISQSMLERAKKFIRRGINLQLADNNKLPFKDAYFSAVTAKNVTNFSSDELARVLEDRGRFIFREYGSGKGLIEVANLFKDRLIRPRDTSYYVNELRNAGFDEIQVQEFRVIKEYSLEELISVVRMFPFVKNMSNLDLRKIEKRFSNERKIKITSDPFILIARRVKK